MKTAVRGICLGLIFHVLLAGWATAATGGQITTASSAGGEYIAFSLQVAQRRIQSLGKDRDYRTVYPEVFRLAGINQIHGLVLDRQNHDVILVGSHAPERQPLTLDDFTVALRARFIHGKWPVVSIDPVDDTARTQMQRVRFEGGIEDTQFGADLFDADYRLKRIGMGLLPAAVPGFMSEWDLAAEERKRRSGGSHKIRSRFWFYPVLPNVVVRDDVVAIKGLKVGVFTEVLAAEVDGKKIEDLASFQDATGESFAKAVSEQFDALARAHPSFSRVQGLDELVALTKAIEDMDPKPDLDYWLQAYRVKPVATEKELKVLARREDFEQRGPASAYRGTYEMSGGVQLMAIALRLNAGDVSALRDAVVKTRPKPETLNWSFVVGEWLIPTAPGILTMEDVAPLFAQAVFLQEKAHYEDAIALYGKVIELKPDWESPYVNRGAAYGKRGEWGRALTDLNRALELNPKHANAYVNRGTAYARQGDPERAVADYNRALELNPRDAEAYYSRGTTYWTKGDLERAVADYNRALELTPSHALAYNNRGVAYGEKGDLDRALADYTRALELNPKHAEAYWNRGQTYVKRGDWDRALADYSRALELNPKSEDAYNNRGIAYGEKGDWDGALADFNRALELNPKEAMTYDNRGNAYAEKGEMNKACSDLKTACDLGYCRGYQRLKTKGSCK